MHKPLLLKLTGLVLVVTLLSMGVTTFFVMLFAKNTLINNLYTELVSDARLVDYWLEDSDQEQLMHVVEQLGTRSGRRISLIDYDGNIVVDSEYPTSYFDNQAKYPEVEQVRQSEIGTSVRFCSVLDQEFVFVALAYEQGIIRLAASTTEIMNPLSVLSNAAVIFTIIASLIALIVTYFVNRNIAGPVNEMLALTENLQNAKFGRRVLVRSTDEIGQLGRAFNELSSTLEELFKTIHDRENMLDAVLSSMEDGVLVVNTNLKVIMANRSVAEMVNEEKDSLDGKDLIEVFQSYQLVEIASDALSAKKTIPTEIRLDTERERIMAVNSSPLENEQGTVIGIVMVLRDITALRRLESMRKEFVANVSHELRTPLTSIKGFIETILSGEEIDPKLTRRFLNIVDGETDRMITLINDLLDLSRLESGKQRSVMEKVNLKKLFDDTVMILDSKAKEKGIKLDNRLNDMVVSGDPKLLRQLTINLVDNAIKYNKKGGRVWIEGEIEKNTARISVCDTGFGIPQDQINRIFERFYRVDKGRSRRMGGTGLGLSIVKHIIDRHKGKIYAESKDNKGTKISFTLSLAQ